MARLFTDVLDRLIAAVPEDAPLRADLERIKADIFVILPEADGEWWGRLQAVLNRNLWAKPFNDWQRRVADIAMGADESPTARPIGPTVGPPVRAKVSRTETAKVYPIEED